MLPFAEALENVPLIASAPSLLMSVNIWPAVSVKPPSVFTCSTEVLASAIKPVTFTWS